jgi:cytochrome c
MAVKLFGGPVVAIRKGRGWSRLEGLFKIFGAVDILSVLYWCDGMTSLLKLLVTILCMAAAPSPIAIAFADSAQRGLIFVEENCAQCHAIGQSNASPMTDAPPLRSLQSFYEVEDLEESLAEGIVTGHPSMPVFHLDPGQIGDVISYLETLE